MDSKRIDTIIIGAGITGSVLSHFTNSLVIDKAKMAGGRCSTGRIDSNIFFDKGATMYKKSFAYYFNSKEKEFNLNEYLNNNFPLIKYMKICLSPKPE